MTQKNSQLTRLLTVESTIADSTVTPKKAKIYTASYGTTTTLTAILGNQSNTFLAAKCYLITSINGLDFRITSMMTLMANSDSR